MESLKRFASDAVRVVYFTVCLLGALYLGVGGWITVYDHEQIEQLISEKIPGPPVEYQSIVYHSAADVKVAIIEEQQEASAFSWMFYAPEPVRWLLIASGFGALGGIMRLVGEMGFRRKKLAEVSVFSGPLLGSLAGFFTWGLIYALVQILTGEQPELAPVSLLLACMIAGFWVSRSQPST